MSCNARIPGFGYTLAFRVPRLGSYGALPEPRGGQLSSKDSSPSRSLLQMRCMFLLIFSRGQSHHLITSSLSIVFSSNLFRTTRAGLPATMEYGSTSFVTTDRAPITAPCPMVIEGIIIASLPIHTSLPMTTSPFGTKSTSRGFKSLALGQSSGKAHKG